MPSPSVLALNYKTVFHNVGRRFVNLDSLPLGDPYPTLAVLAPLAGASAAYCGFLYGTMLPPSTRQVGAFIAQEFGLVYESRSGLVALLHRLGLEYHKPQVIPRKLDEAKQKAFIGAYDKLLNSLGNDEVVLFADAVHPTHAARPVGCWAPKQDNLAIEQTSGATASIFTARSTSKPDRPG
jgi:hypothetical protein